jgi:hypothetical protein
VSRLQTTKNCSCLPFRARIHDRSASSHNKMQSIFGVKVDLNLFRASLFVRIPSATSRGSFISSRHAGSTSLSDYCRRKLKSIACVCLSEHQLNENEFKCCSRGFDSTWQLTRLSARSRMTPAQPLPSRELPSIRSLPKNAQR